MKKKPIAEKHKRKKAIGFMAMLATMVYKVVNGSSGVCGIHPHLDRRDPGLKYVPGVQLQPWKFMELFGDDTEYEYIQDRYGDMSVITEMNGVMFHALINSMDLIRDGRLV